MAAKIPTHTCVQEGPIGELKAKINTMGANVNKVEKKVDDILETLYRCNEDTKVKHTELYGSFKNIEAMLSTEAALRKKMSDEQKEIYDNVGIISARVNNIEHDISNIKSDLSDTKQNIKQNNEGLVKRVSNLEKVFGYVYAFGAVIVALTFIIIYGHQLLQIIYPKSPKIDNQIVQQK